MSKRSRRNSEADAYQQADILYTLEELSNSRTERRETEPDENPLQIELIDGFEDCESDDDSPVVSARVDATELHIMDIDTLGGQRANKQQPTTAMEDNYRIQDDPDLLRVLRHRTIQPQSKKYIARSSQASSAEVGGAYFVGTGQPRQEFMGYGLEREPAFKKPERIDMPIRTREEEERQSTFMKTISPSVKACIRHTIGMVIRQWPADVQGIAKANLSIVTADSFYMERFRPILEHRRNEEMNANMVLHKVHQNKSVGYCEAWDMLEYSGVNDDSKLKRDLFRRQILRIFLDFTKGLQQQKEAEIKNAREEGEIDEGEGEGEGGNERQYEGEGISMGQAEREIKAKGNDKPKLKGGEKETEKGKAAKGKEQKGNNFANTIGLPPALVQALKESTVEREELECARKFGQWMYQKATWIPCDRISKHQVKNLKGKIVVESESIFALGVASGAFNKNNAVLVDQSWIRICRPGPQGEPVCLILWARDDPNDCKPTESKIFGAVIYGADKLTRIASPATNRLVRTEMNVIIATISSREGIKRRLRDLGTMVKTVGTTHSAGGHIYTPQLTVTRKSANPKETTLQNIAKQTSLRAELKRDTPCKQADSMVGNYKLKLGQSDPSTEFCIFAGISPTFCKGTICEFGRQEIPQPVSTHRDMKEVAMAAGLINRYGAPDSSSFAAFGYCAALHYDEDDTVSMGWVSDRPTTVQSDESGFVYGDFKVLVEMETDMHWIWDARRSLHGTTMNRVAGKLPKSWKIWAKSHPDTAQWTRVIVITHQGAMAGKRDNPV